MVWRRRRCRQGSDLIRRRCTGSSEATKRKPKGTSRLRQTEVLLLWLKALIAEYSGSDESQPEGPVKIQTEAPARRVFLEDEVLEADQDGQGSWESCQERLA